MNNSGIKHWLRLCGAEIVDNIFSFHKVENFNGIQ
jgi:hypothetical protein